MRAQIFGTTFEITSRYAFLSPRFRDGEPRTNGEIDRRSDTRTYNLWGWVLSDLSGRFPGTYRVDEMSDGKNKEADRIHFGEISSARDQLTSQPVAVKKIMKPFSTPVLSKRTYRELKLLKHLRHENVGSTRAKG